MWSNPVQAIGPELPGVKVAGRRQPVILDYAVAGFSSSLSKCLTVANPSWEIAKLAAKLFVGYSRLHDDREDGYGILGYVVISIRRQRFLSARKHG